MEMLDEMLGEMLGERLDAFDHLLKDIDELSAVRKLFGVNVG